MSQINDLLNASQAEFSAQRNETKGLVTKWEATGLLEGVAGEYDKHNTAILLENQAKQLISESNTSGQGANAEDWNGVALPLVRRIFGELSAKEFVSVQPMNLPSGLVFWMDFKYGTDKGRHTDGGSIFGNADKKGAASMSAALYGAGGEGAAYSLKASSTASTLVTAATASTNLLDFDADLALAAYFVSGTATFTASAYNTSSNAISFAGATGTGTVYWYTNTLDANLRGDFEDRVQPEINSTTATDDLGIPEIEVNLQNEALVAKTRKLKVKWSPEFAQDLNAYHSIDAEAELTSMLSEYITMEIDMEILQMLRTAAAFTATHTFPTLSGGTNYSDQFATIGHTLQAVSNTIHQSTMRGGANFIVCSPEIATYLENIPGYSVDTEGTAAKFAMGVTAVGSLKNRFTIYKNPYWTGKDILMGYRGNQFLETGAVFAPYIPLIMTPLVYDPTNFTPRKGIMTRYAKKVVRRDYYGVVNVVTTNATTIGAVTTA